MSRSKSYVRLYDIPALPEEVLAQKFAKTKDWYYDEKSVENFQKETIRYGGSETPLHEEELPRIDNINRTNRLNLMEYGSRYTHEPFHPELFLGDITKDERGTVNEPTAHKVTEQNRYRQIKYKEGKLSSDASNNVIEGVLPARRINELVKGGFNDTARRFTGTFDESTDGMSVRNSIIPGSSKSQYEMTVAEDQKYYQQNDETIVPVFGIGENPISKISNSIGATWNSQPSQNFKVSSVSNLYRAKTDVDESANAVFRLAQQDTEFTDGDGTLIVKPMLQLFDDIKKQKKYNTSINAEFNTDSDKIALYNRVDNSLASKGGILQTTNFDHKKGSLEQFIKDRFLKQHNPNNNRKNVALHTQTIKDNFYQNGVNRSKEPTKDKLKIIRSVVKDNKEKLRENFIRNNKSNVRLFKELMNSNRVGKGVNEKGGTHTASKKEQMESTTYSQSNTQANTDMISNTEQSKQGFYEASERFAAITSHNTSKPMVNLGNFEFDQDPTTDNSVFDQGGKGNRNLGSLRQHKLYDNDINDLSELTNTSTRK
jgi:hypothetical protein